MAYLLRNNYEKLICSMNNDPVRKVGFIAHGFWVRLRCAVVAVAVFVLVSSGHAGQVPGDVVWDLSGQLHKAAEYGWADEVRALLKANPDLVSSIDIETNTPLHLAVESGHENIVELLLANTADINAKNKSGQTPLDLAVEWGQTNIAKVLLAHGANIGDALVCALQTARPHKNMVELLLAAGADVNARDDKGNTPLDVTWEPDIAELLLARGANVNAKDSRGETALHCAVVWGDKDMAKWLIAHNADVNAGDKYGKTPLDDAVMSAATIWGNKEMADLLIANGADVNAKCTNGVTALFLAAGVVPGHPDPETPTLLATNAIAIEKDFVKLLMAHGADINVEGSEGYTPLHAAVLAENTNMVDLLLANRANVNAIDNKGETPLRLAIENTNDDIAIILRQHGGRE
jgi:ankyrin repeat protein